MNFSLLSLFFLFLAPSSMYFYPVILIGFWVAYLLSSSFSLLQSSLLGFYNDEVSLFIVYMTVFVLFISYIYALYLRSYWKVSLVFVIILFFCCEVFTTTNLLYLYLFYEASLLPILYVILNWGSYPERSLSALLLLIYTSLFTFPFIAVIFVFNLVSGSLCLSPWALISFSSSYLGSLSSLVIFVAFAVNLPIYGLHFWLPIAHVEAPTFGSIILAGVLLKLGGVGLIRCSPLLDFPFLGSVLLAYLIVSMLYVTIVCMFQSDLKRLIAYSSVSHMMSIPILLLANNTLSVKSAILVMLFHGLSSPVLFMLVGILYSLFSSRQLVLLRGLMLTSPLLSLLLILSFFFTLSAPPFPSFISEVYFFVSSFVLSSYMLYVFILFSFMSLIYNLNWLTAIVFSKSSPTSLPSPTFTYLSFFPVIACFLLCVPLILLFHLI